MYSMHWRFSILILQVIFTGLQGFRLSGKWNTCNPINKKPSIKSNLLRHFPDFAAGQQETAKAIIFKVGFTVVGYRLPIRRLFTGALRVA